MSRIRIKLVFGDGILYAQLAERRSDIDEAYDTTRLLEYIKKLSIAERDCELTFFPASERGKAEGTRQGKRIEYPFLYLNGSLQKAG